MGRGGAGDEQRLRRTFRSLRTRNFRIYAGGSFVSISGTWMQRIAQDWLIVELGGGGLELGISVAAQFLPLLLLGLWGGLLVDRVNRRRLLFVTQSVQAVLALVLATLVLGDVVTLPGVYVFSLLVGLVAVVDGPARQVLVAEMVPRDDIANAQAIYSSVHNTGRLLGPAVAGTLIALGGVSVAFYVNAISFVAVLLSLKMLDPRVMTESKPLRRKTGQLREALVQCWHHREMRACLILVAVMDIIGQNFRVILPLFAAGALSGDAETYGYLMGALGGGAVLGAFVSAAMDGRSAGRLVLFCALFGVVNLALVVEPGFIVASAMMLGLGFTNVLFNNFARGLLILESDVNMQGRVMAVHGLLSRGGTPVGAPLIGLVCAVGGVRAGFGLAGAAVLVASIFALVVLRRSPSSAVDPSQPVRS